MDDKPAHHKTPISIIIIGTTLNPSQRNGTSIPTVNYMSTPTL